MPQVGMRRFIKPADLDSLLRVHCEGRRLAELERLAGSTSKGVYRLTFDDGGTLAMYAWRAAENYWPDGTAIAGDPFAGPSCAADFAACHAALTAAAVRVPHLHVIDVSQDRFPADIARVPAAAHDGGRLRPARAARGR
jgi:hypothetical protein